MLRRTIGRQALTCWCVLAPLLAGSAAHAEGPIQPAGTPAGQPASEPARAETPAPEAPAARSSTTRQPTAAQLAAAKVFYARGAALYTQGRYDAAWFEFSSAYQIAPLPDLLFNMARSEEKLNRPADAAKHYREFLEQSPGDEDAQNIRAKIALLEQPAGTSSSSPAASGGARRFPVYSAIAGGGTLLFTIIGAAALGAASVRYDELARTCAPSCRAAEVMPLQQTIQAGQAFISLAAIGAAGTVGLLVWELRRDRRPR